MKNLRLEYFTEHGNLCDGRMQYAFLNKQFSPERCGARMVQNVKHDKENFLYRVTYVLEESIGDGVITRFIYDKQFGSGSYIFLFKVDVYGYVMFTCDDKKLLEESVSIQKELLIKDIENVFEKFNKIMARG